MNVRRLMSALDLVWDHHMRAAAKAKMATTEHQGIPITLDRPKGYVQTGTDPEGNAWKRLYRYDYGFIPKTAGGDDEDTDVFLGPNPDAPNAWWAVQTKEDGSFDEYKVFLGFSTLALARGCYNMHIPPRFCAGFFSVPVAAMKSILGQHPTPVIQGLIKMRNRLTKSNVSFDTLMSAVAAALNDAYPPQGPDGNMSPSSVFPIELYDDSVVFSQDGKYMKDGYTFANGAASLAGSPVAVMRTYVPMDQAGAAPAPGEVTMSQKNKVNKDGAAGAGDIIELAATRLAAVAATTGSGDGMITPEIAAELDAVMSLVDVARNLYPGGAPAAPDSANDMGGDDGEGNDLEMSEMAAEKRGGGVVKMSAEKFAAYVTKQLAAVKKEADPAKALAKQTRLEALMTAAVVHFAKSADEPIPVLIVPEADSAPKTEATPDLAQVLATQQPNGAAVTTGANGANAPGTADPALAKRNAPAAVSGGERLTKAVSSVAGLRARLSGQVAKSDGEPAPAAADAETAAATFTPEYIDGLPDSAFLFIDDDGTHGPTPKNARHFPVIDKAGNTSAPMIQKALDAMEQWGATSTVKRTVKARAESLITFAKGEKVSQEQAAKRGDSGWATDLAPPNTRAPASDALKKYGHDNILGKLAETAGK